jgi:hypothetical protein
MFGNAYDNCPAKTTYYAFSLFAVKFLELK